MLSVRVLMVMGSGLVLVTTALKVKVPPGAGRLVGAAVLTTCTVGSTSVMPTVASSVSVAVWLSSSTAVAVTMSVWVAPALPVKLPGKLQGTDVAPGASTVPMSAPQVEPGMTTRFP
jgi:hypothetical protein